MLRIGRRNVGIGRSQRSLTVLVAVLFMSPFVPTSAAAAPAEISDAVTWMSPEQYAEKFGVEALARELSPEQAATVAAGMKETAAMKSSAPTQAGDSALLDPGGGSDGKWWSVMYGTKDRRGKYIPIRLGDSNLGYRHYAARHNILKYQPFHAAMQTSRPDVEIGAHAEYLALMVDSSLHVTQTLRFIVQLATHTDESPPKYRTPDGAVIGVITGYCENRKHTANRCPDWVNAYSQF